VPTDAYYDFFLQIISKICVGILDILPLMETVSFTCTVLKGINILALAGADEEKPMSPDNKNQKKPGETLSSRVMTSGGILSNRFFNKNSRKSNFQAVSISVQRT
jgi:hypothetical protein